MKKIALLALALIALPTWADDKGSKMTALDFKMKNIEGKEIDLAQYKGKVVLFVNVASFCGYTKQYTGMEKLYEALKDQGFVLIGVPANEFGAQEPGSDEEIAKFCTSKYNVTFPILSKVVVKGKGICPLYAYLTGKDTNPKFAGDIGWNFEKFLVGKDGNVVARYKSGATPESIKSDIEAELKK
jgi:glutathione peroxidase